MSANNCFGQVKDKSSLTKLGSAIIRVAISFIRNCLLFICWIWTSIMNESFSNQNVICAQIERITIRRGLVLTICSNSSFLIVVVVVFFLNRCCWCISLNSVNRLVQKPIEMCSMIGFFLFVFICYSFFSIHWFLSHNERVRCRKNRGVFIVFLRRCLLSSRLFLHRVWWLSGIVLHFPYLSPILFDRSLV